MKKLIGISLVSTILSYACSPYVENIPVEERSTQSNEINIYTAHKDEICSNTNFADLNIQNVFTSGHEILIPEYLKETINKHLNEATGKYYPVQICYKNLENGVIELTDVSHKKSNLENLTRNLHYISLN